MGQRNVRQPRAKPWRNRLTHPCRAKISAALRRHRQKRFRHCAEHFAIAREAVIGQDDIAARHGDRVAISICRGRRQTQWKQERISVVPSDLRHLGAGHRVGRRHSIAGQSHHLASCGIGIGLVAGLRTDDFFKDQNRPLRECGMMSRERGRQSTLRQATTLVTPGIEAQLIVIGIQRVQRFHGFEHDVRLLVDPRIVGDQRGLAGDLRRQLRPYRNGRIVDINPDDIGGHLHLHPGSGVTPLADHVIHEARMTADGDPLTRRPEVGLCRDSVLLITQLVGGIGQRFHQHDAKIRRVPLCPLRHEDRHAVEHETPEAGIILHQIIDIGRGNGLRRTKMLRRAIERARTLHLEGKLDRGQLWVDAGRYRVVRRPRHQPQGIHGEVSRLIDFDRQHIRMGSDSDPEHMNGGDTFTAFDPDVIRREHQRAQRFDEMHLQLALPLGFGRRGTVKDFKIVDAVQGRMIAHSLTPELVTAGIGHGMPPCTKVSVTRFPPRRTTYRTVTRNAASIASTATPSTMISSPSHRWSALCTST